MLTPDMLLISKADEQTGDCFDTVLLRFEAERGKAERERAREREKGEGGKRYRMRSSEP
jgi:hypothetical protein